MIITILIFVGLIIGIVLMILDGWCWGIGCASTVICGGAMLFAVIAVLVVNVPKEIDYQNALYEKEVIEYRIDHSDENIVGNELLYSDIVEFNNNLRCTKKWANNPWTNWFYNNKIAAIDYIDFEGRMHND